MKHSSTLGLLLALAATLFATPSALAHSFVDHCTPGVGASLQQPPAQLNCVFTEAVDAKQTQFTVTDANNNRVDNNDLKSDPNDVAITIKVANFALGQGGRRWQVYLDGNLVTQVTDGSTITTIKAVKKGDYALKMALATDDKTVVATAGIHLTVGPADAAPSAQPVPKTLPKTGSDQSPDQVFVLILTVGGLLLLGASRVLRRTR